MKTLYNKLVYKLFPESLPEYEVSTDEIGEQPILSPEDWKVLMSAPQPKTSNHIKQTAQIPDQIAS